VLPNFGSPTLFPTDRPTTAPKGGTQIRYNRYVKREAAEILKEGLALPTEARAALAGSLLDSLDTDVDEDAEAAWASEINRRVAELDTEAAKTVPWAEVRRRLAAR
jgi:putative addiction module component (TIGR02574 family)